MDSFLLNQFSPALEPDMVINWGRDRRGRGGTGQWLGQDWRKSDQIREDGGEAKMEGLGS
jgi:hypothetical protein